MGVIRQGKGLSMGYGVAVVWISGVTCGGCGHDVACLFFFQAEDGIRDYKVTGVQTCALPICPSGEPVIGIPFYLADARLAKLEAAVNDLESSREVIMYLRHEAGHAFNYAYELYRTPEWNALFGSFRRAYRDDYRATPFSRDYVRYLPGWYAQKHPDEDFAETFAVWLTPRSGWRTKYKNWGAMAKLNYMDRIARKLRDRAPVRPKGEPDVTTAEMETTVAEFYEKWLTEEPKPVELPGAMELEEIFGTRKRKSTQPVAEVIAQH